MSIVCPYCGGDIGLITSKKANQAKAIDTSYVKTQQIIDRKLGDRGTPCRYCTKEIFFNKQEHDDTGKWVPRNGDGSEHRCRTPQ